jgi:hypothetical protein
MSNSNKRSSHKLSHSSSRSSSYAELKTLLQDIRADVSSKLDTLSSKLDYIHKSLSSQIALVAEVSERSFGRPNSIHDVEECTEDLWNHYEQVWESNYVDGAHLDEIVEIVEIDEVVEDASIGKE